MSIMNETGWQYVGKLVRLRRERLGLSQQDLQQYGGPGVSTIGKVENGRQDNFPTRTQQQIEKALGWKLGQIAEIIAAIDEPWFTDQREDFEESLIEESLPDLTLSGPPVSRASELTDAELLAELTYRMHRYAQEKENRHGAPIGMETRVRTEGGVPTAAGVIPQEAERVEHQRALPKRRRSGE